MDVSCISFTEMFRVISVRASRLTFQSYCKRSIILMALSVINRRICALLTDKGIHGRMRKHYGSIFLLFVLLLLLTSCQLTQSAFAKTVGDAGSAFAAASTTLTYAHEGKITMAYAASS